MKERCYNDSDCPADQVCGATGRCEYECTTDQDCGEGFECAGHRCKAKTPVTPLTCPEDMVPVADLFCVDRYEASRPDATATFSGKDESKAVSRAAVMPWLVKDNAAAQTACEEAGKRLCTPAEWELACRGADGQVYAYGDEYDPETCNGIETFGPGKFHLEPTGSFQDCTNEWGVFDMNGNVWEHVFGGDDRSVRGGAFNCSDSKTFHRCDYVPRTWTPAALGFRCCLGRTEVKPDPTPENTEEVLDVAEEVAEGGGEGGCLPTDEGQDLVSPEDAPRDEATLDAGTDTREEEPGGPADASDIGPGVECPEDMVPVPLGEGRVVCMDRYEASRADATADSPGTLPVATSRPGVMPWHVSQMSLQALQEFRAGCEAAGKRLCTKEEWFEACNGPDDTVYFFGNTWNPEICNCVDTFCDDHCAEHGISPCNTSENCGYQYYCFHVVPTGSFSNCTNAYGLYDVNGNVWEVVPVDTPRGYEVRGGAFNCGNPSQRLRCDFNANWDSLYAGFRCCKDPVIRH